MATVLVHSGLERMTFYDGRGTHHVRNPSRPSPRFSYCKRQKLGWRPGNEASEGVHVREGGRVWRRKVERVGGRVW